MHWYGKPVVAGCSARFAILDGSSVGAERSRHDVQKPPGARRPVMLLYFPAENAAVPAVVSLCSCEFYRSLHAEGSTR